MSRTNRKRTPYYQGTDFDTERDKKKWYKPNKSFKESRKQSRKAKEKEHFKKNEEHIEFKKDDEWDWN